MQDRETRARRLWLVPLVAMSGVVLGLLIQKEMPLGEARSLEAEIGRLQAAVEGSTKTMAALDACVKKLNGVVEGLEGARREATVTDAPSRDPIRPRADDEGQDHAASNQNVDGGSRVCNAWVTVLRKEVAHLLVEFGRTPFDAGVAPLVRTAEDGLVVWDAHRAVARASVTARLGTRDWDDEMARVGRASDEEYTRVLSALRQGLQGLENNPAGSGVEKQVDETQRSR